MNRIFYTSDTHFHHRNIRKYCPESRDIFIDDTDMNESMIRNWNSVVTDTDIVYHLGDFAFADYDESLAIFRQLKGQKHLIIGNHDKVGKRLPWLSKNLSLSIRDNETTIIMSHYPMEDWDRRFHGSYHFHGHVHSCKARPMRFMERRYDVGVDNLGFIPMTFSQIKEEMQI